MTTDVRSISLPACIVSAVIISLFSSSNACALTQHPRQLKNDPLTVAQANFSIPPDWDEERFEAEIYQEILRDLDEWSDVDILDEEILEALEDDQDLADRNDGLGELDDDIERQAIVQAISDWQHTETYCHEQYGDAYYADFSLSSDEWYCAAEVSQLPDSAQQRIAIALNPKALPLDAIAQGSSQTRRPAPQIAAATSNNVAATYYRHH